MSADLKESSVPLAEISNAPSAFESFLDRNQKGLMVFAVVLALGAVGVIIQRGLEKSRQEDAGAALVKATDLASLQTVVDANGGTTAGGSAMLLLANSQWTGGKQDDAVATLKKFIAENPDHAAIPTAKASLGAKLMAQGKSGDATKLLDEVASDPAAAYIAPFALISIGDMAQTGGDLTKAEESYTKVRNDFPDSSFADSATKRIASLKAKAPAEIAPPPAPPTPPAGAATDQGVLDAIKASMPPGVTVTPEPTPPPATPPATPPAPAPETAPAPEP